MSDTAQKDSRTFLTPRKRATIAWVSVGALAIAASATFAPHAGWVADVIACLAAQWLLLGVLLSIVLLACRRFAAAATALGIALTFLFVLIPGRAPEADPSEATTSGHRVIRVLHLNTNSLNPRSAEIYSLIVELNPDILSLVEPPTDLVNMIRDSDTIASRYSPFYLATGARAGWPLLLTRWPQYGGPDWSPGPMWRTNPSGGEGYVMRVEHPGGPFFLLQTHPISPRSPSRWSAGNERVVAVARRVRTDLEPQDLPIILACDLNGTPSGWRSRRLIEDSSLLRAKPLLKSTGTFPAYLPWPLSIAIDDLFVTPDVRILNWSSITIPGSDHCGVLVELRLPISNSEHH